MVQMYRNHEEEGGAFEAFVQRSATYGLLMAICAVAIACCMLAGPSAALGQEQEQGQSIAGADNPQSAVAVVASDEAADEATATDGGFAGTQDVSAGTSLPVDGCDAAESPSTLRPDAVDSSPAAEVADAGEAVASGCRATSDEFIEEPEVILEAQAVASEVESDTILSAQAVSVSEAQSVPAFLLSTKNFTFSKKTAGYNTLYVYPMTDGGSAAPDMKKVVVGNTSILGARLVRYGGAFSYFHAELTPKKAGVTTVTYTDEYGQTQTATIRVNGDYFPANLNSRSSLNAYYRDKTVYADTVPGAKITLKVGKQKQTKYANKSGHAVFKLKKAPTFKQSCKATFETTYGKVTKTKKAQSRVWASRGTVNSCRYYVPVTAYNVAKGDVIVVKSNRETQKYKVNRTRSTLHANVTMSKLMRNYSWLQILVKNSKGQTLYTGAKSYIRWGR